MYQPRTPLENPYCVQQLVSQPPIEPVAWDNARGWCPDCGRLAHLRKNGTAKLHKVYGRREMARRIAAAKRGEAILMPDRTIDDIKAHGNPRGDGQAMPCYRCGRRPAILPIAYCLDCYAAMRGVDDLVTATDIAQRLGTVQVTTVSQWAVRYEGFPPPVLSNRGANVWRWRAVEEWLRETGRIEGED